jgi:streptogramin lyase
VSRARRTLLIAVAAAALAGLALTVLTGGGVPRGEGPAAPAPSLPPSPVVARIDLGGKPQQLVLGADGLWAASDGAVRRLDPSSGRVQAKVPVGRRDSPPSGLGAGAGAVWVPTVRPGVLWRVEPASGRVNGRIGLGEDVLEPVPVAADPEAVWVGCCALDYGHQRAGRLLRIDPRGDRVTGRIPVPEGPLALATGAGAVWVATARGTLLRVDPAGGRVAGRLPFGGGSRLQAVAVSRDRVWLADTGGEQVLQVDPAGPRVTMAVPAPRPRSLAAGPAGIWVVVTNDRTLARLDEAGRRLCAPIPAGYLRGVRGVVVGEDAVWATTGEELVRIDPARATETLC